MIVMGGLVKKLCLEKYSPMQWNTQAGNINTNLKVKIYFTSPALSATNVVTWNCHVDDSSKGRYDIILGRYLLTELGLNQKLSEHVIKVDDGTLNRFTTPMVDLGTYTFKILNTLEITPDESFTNYYAKEVYDSKHEHTATKELRLILYAKYEKTDLHKVMDNQCQYNNDTT